MFRTPNTSENAPVAPIFDPTVVAVFGESRLRQGVGNEASAETTGQFIDTVTTLCAERDNDDSVFAGARLRDIQTDHGLPFQLQTQTHPKIPDRSFSEAEARVSTARITAANIRQGKIPFSGGHQFTETLLVADDGNAQLFRSISDKHGKPIRSAIKSADETEVVAAITALTEAAAKEPQLLSTIAR